MVEGGRVDMGVSCYGNSGRIRYSQRESCGEGRSRRALSVRGDGRGDRVGESCGEDCSQRRVDDCVDRNGHNGLGQGSIMQYYGSDRRRSCSSSKS